MTTPTLDQPLPPPTAPDTSPPPPGGPGGPAPTPAAPSPEHRSTYQAGHIVALVIGCVLLLPSFGMLAGGGAAVLAQTVVADDDGYFDLRPETVHADGVAVTADDRWVGDDFDRDDYDGDLPWVLDLLDVDLRIRATGTASTDEVFVGIGRAADVDAYLDGAAYAVVRDVDGRRISYDVTAGATEVEPPAAQDFWVASASGSGEQELEWEARSGRWAVVVMNADGTAVVDADVELGARSGAVLPIGITLMVVGALGIASAVVLIVIGARGRRSSTA